MTSQFYAFTGNERQSMAFTPVLDGTVYNCQLKWNIAAQRWYLLITDSSDNTVINTALVGSPVAGGINLISGIFSSTEMYWREKNGQIEVTS
ncbi:MULTISPECIES: hypothetical protein [Enterobacteriaceae]|uniref:phage baseplate plug family protein n=1 Tax=Enterobacteriaceae TaxID=543 RepID=UPI0010CA6F1D|nr:MULTISPECIES: hypothetical protein [Citrobacter]QLU14933.1 hypothetical protein HV147_14010 [Citrobacter freundii]TKV23502.1 hypothetical protein FDX01_04510 [Citrobacter sp. wls613]HCR3322885.1 hypothetical protein [Citrobacter freundii]HEE9909075.1 hypothetical protein [Citrobacter braakii]